MDECLIYNFFQEAEDIHKEMMKKYSSNKDVWINAGQFYYGSKRFSQARTILENAYKALPKSERKIVSKYL